MMILKVSEKTKLITGGWLLACILLLVIASVLKGRINFVKRENQENRSLLDEALPDFNDQSPQKLAQDIKNLKLNILSQECLYSRQDSWLKEGYDPGILFAEDLSIINQYLKQKAQNKNTEFADIEFLQKMPSEQEAVYLLSQLHGLKEILNLGIELGVNFEVIKPQPIQELEDDKGIRVAKTYLELSCPKETLIEFLIQMNYLVPRAYLEFLSIKSQGEVFDLVFSFKNIILTLDWAKDDLGEEAAIKSPDSLLGAGQGYISVLRGRNPFHLETPKIISATEVKEEVRLAPRFLYKGTAVSKEKEIVVIQDTMSEETVFIGLNGSYGDFKLKEFSDQTAVFENVKDNSTIIIKKEE
ncbi:MAG: hypothetical protein ABIG56_06330 [Candidatus Omnitrophota bacterium]